MKAKEKEFCRQMAVYANPLRAAQAAGYQQPEKVLSGLLTREDIAREVQRLSANTRMIYRSMVACGLFRLACGDVGDAMDLVMNREMVADGVQELDLSCVQEIKSTDKGIEMKFCDRIKALEKLSETVGQSGEYGGGLEEAMLRSAQALAHLDERRVTSDEV